MNKREMKKLVWLEIANSLMLKSQKRENTFQQIVNREYEIKSPAALKRLDRAIDSVQQDILNKIK